ncbi:hypothetical protein O6H91_01G056900 [Diphasiastrum complanatum]|uniref:Uncharacterized protein n=1 Tax=Diphasiastrum complanatum TaxID=34168 RepID=A0ACC2ERH0_DIPCM|nr:hypothetical protein O6H91_01G056900 [Diphasiastrum complanatum]
MTKAWSGAGAWADDAEQAEAEAKTTAAFAAPEAFPSLGEAVSAKPQKKKKHQTITLSELLVGKPVGPGSKSRQLPDSHKLTTKEMMMLPTGPRDRSDEEPQSGGLGGGFKDYGGYRGSDRDQERNPNGDPGYGERNRGFGGGFERERAVGGFGRDRDDASSRADENADWGAAKKFVPSQGGGGFDDDRRSGRSSDRDLPSRADEVENWGSAKKFTPANDLDQRSSKFGFEDMRRGYGEGFSSRGGYQEAPSRRGAWDSGAESDRWSRRNQSENGFSELSERPRLVLQPRSRNVNDDESFSQNAKPLYETADTTTKARSNPFGSARPREEVLAEKGQECVKTDSDSSAIHKDSRSSSSHSSRPATPDSSVDLPVKPHPRVNPFGDAKPREVLLQEKGEDWRKIDFELEHRSVDRPLSDEEKRLKDEIDFLSEQLKMEKNELGPEEKLNAAGQKQSIQFQIYVKERELEQLMRALDDKIRFSQRGGEKPVSHSRRPKAGTGMVYEPPHGETGAADVWTRQSNGDQYGRGRDRFESKAWQK